MSVALLPAAGFGRESKIRAVRATADAFVSAASRNANFGRARNLRVDATPPTRPYMRFRLSIRDEEEIKHVSLLLWSSNRLRLGYQVRLVAPKWSERKITFDNAPHPSARFATSGPVRAGAWKAVDVTSLVGGNEEHVSFVVTTRSPNGAEFASREAGLHGPRLVVETQARARTTTGTTTGVTETGQAPGAP